MNTKLTSYNGQFLHVASSMVDSLNEAALTRKETMTARTAHKIPDHVAAILRAADIGGPNDTHLKITQQLDPKTYKECAKILEAIGGKWNRSAQATIFTKPVRDVLSEALDNGEVVNKKNLLQAFYTPMAAADLLIEAACLEGGSKILEPSAGSGALIDACIRDGSHTILRNITAIEMDREAFTALDATYNADRCLLECVCQDFLDLSVAKTPYFDRVIMNPPFSNGQDAKHILHALKFLKPGGILVAIVSSAFVTKQTGAYRAMHAAIHDYGYEWIALPEESFKESGTNIATGILKLIKPT